MRNLEIGTWACSKYFRRDSLLERPEQTAFPDVELHARNLVIVVGNAADMAAGEITLRKLAARSTSHPHAAFVIVA